MSIDVIPGPKIKMIHAAVNTDPLQMNIDDSSKPIYYGLKEREIPHVKINDVKEIKVWYDLGEKIGEGGFGIVIAVTDKATRKPWAMKTVSKTTAGDRLTLLQREIRVLKMISHPHIIYLDKVFESNKYMYMVFEKCYGDFAQIYQERKPFMEKVARRIIAELVDAVAYLHKYDIVHRDLKLENILLGANPEDPDDEYYIKLTDFGLSIVKYGQGFESTLHEYCGTLYYMAPEMITNRSYTQMCDMWAIGVILYMLITGHYPFKSSYEKDTQMMICTREPSFTKLPPNTEVLNLLTLLLNKDPAKRIRATEVLQHPWITNKKTSKTPCNILDKMREWKSEMKVETGAASDWMLDSCEQLVSREKSNTKQSLNLPKTNIEFMRRRRESRPSDARARAPSDARARAPSDARARADNTPPKME